MEKIGRARQKEGEAAHLPEVHIRDMEEGRAIGILALSERDADEAHGAARIALADAAAKRRKILSVDRGALFSLTEHEAALDGDLSAVTQTVGISAGRNECIAGRQDLCPRLGGIDKEPVDLRIDRGASRALDGQGMSVQVDKLRGEFDRRSLGAVRIGHAQGIHGHVGIQRYLRARRDGGKQIHKILGKGLLVDIVVRSLADRYGEEHSLIGVLAVQGIGIADHCGVDGHRSQPCACGIRQIPALGGKRVQNAAFVGISDLRARQSDRVAKHELLLRAVGHKDRAFAADRAVKNAREGAARKRIRRISPLERIKHIDRALGSKGTVFKGVCRIGGRRRGIAEEGDRAVRKIEVCVLQRIDTARDLNKIGCGRALAVGTAVNIRTAAVDGYEQRPSVEGDIVLILRGGAVGAEVKRGVVIHAEHLLGIFRVPLGTGNGGIDIELDAREHRLGGLREGDAVSVQIKIAGTAADAVILIVPARVQLARLF